MGESRGEMGVGGEQSGEAKNTALPIGSVCCVAVGSLRPLPLSPPLARRGGARKPPEGFLKVDA